MPRNVAFLATNFREESKLALDLTSAIEQVRFFARNDSRIRNELKSTRMDLIYELAYIRMFQHWEIFLEDSFVRYLCGYSNVGGQASLVGNAPYFARLIDAYNAVLGGQAFKLWHKPSTVVSRSQGFFTGGLHETVINSNITRLEHFSNIRHRIVHSQEDAKRKFDAASMHLCGQRFPASRPGKFLRTKATVTEVWLEVIANELNSIARQITP